MTVAGSELSKPTPKNTARARAVEKIRSELNIEKWPALWQPAKSKNRPQLRVMERESKTLDGSRVVSRVEVGYTQLGTLTTEEQKMFYVLIKLWEEAGKPTAQVFFSSRGLARMLKKKGWGTNVIYAITKSLRKLRSIPIEWINSFHDETKPGAVVVDRRPFTLLGDLRIVERKQDGAVNSSLGYFKFDDSVLNNLQLNYTKPVCIEEFFKLKSEIAQLIYSHIDLMLYDRTRYERRSRELFDDLGLKNAEYSHMFERKRAIERAIRELIGIRLSSGVLRDAVLEKTVDGKDYKVVFSKSNSTTQIESKLPETAPAGLVVNDYSKPKETLTVQAEEVVSEFYKLFHGVATHYPQSKETAQALALIAQHGLEATRHILRFAHRTAHESNYKPSTFGGILHYTSRALAERARKPEGAAVAQVAVPQQRNKADVLTRGESRLAMLSPEQFQTRAERARGELCRQKPSMARAITERSDSAMVVQLVRAFLIRQLDQEPLDLVIVGSELDPETVRRKLGLQNLPL